MNSVDPRQSPRTIAAVQSKLLVMSEAAIRLGQEAELRCPGPPLAEIRGIGNWQRRQYDAIELPVVRNTVRDDFQDLLNSVHGADAAFDHREPHQPEVVLGREVLHPGVGDQVVF